LLVKTTACQSSHAFLRHGVLHHDWHPGSRCGWTTTTDIQEAAVAGPPRLTSRKPLWLDLQPADIKSRWRHNWKSAQVVNSDFVCNSTIRQPGFDLPRQQWSLLTVFARNRDTAMPAEGNGDLQTLICVLVARSYNVQHCRILSPDKTEWRLISATLCRWRRCLLAYPLWFTTHIREEEEVLHFFEQCSALKDIKHHNLY